VDRNDVAFSNTFPYVGLPNSVAVNTQSSVSSGGSANGALMAGGGVALLGGTAILAAWWWRSRRNRTQAYAGSELAVPEGTDD
jgi:hypothetical protein